MSPFPDEVLEDILSRLPVKCLLRFRCVSKSWLSLITTPSFVKLHLKRSAQTKMNLSLFLSFFSIVYRVDFDSLDEGVIQPAVIDYPPLNLNKMFILWGSCDGLICISYLKDTVFLWNPSTRKCLKLPYEPVEVPNLSNFKLESHYGVAYTCNDYKVVRIVDILDSGGDLLDYEIMAYSLNSNSWHRLEKFPHFRNVSRTGHTVVGGALHWISGFDPEWGEKGRIVALDIRTEKYRVIPHPDYSGPYFLTCLHNFEGSLALSCQYYSMTADVWLLKESGGKNESWSRLITMLPIVDTETQNLEPIAYSKCGKKVLLEMNYEKLFWYDLEQKSVEDIMVHGMEEGDDLVVGLTCLESLVPVDVTSAVANVMSPQEDEKNRADDEYLGLCKAEQSRADEAEQSRADEDNADEELSDLGADDE